MVLWIEDIFSSNEISPHFGEKLLKNYFFLKERTLPILQNVGMIDTQVSKIGLL